MGVDYSAHYGFGIRIERIIPENLEEEYQDDFLYYIDDILDTDMGLNFFEVGSSNYGGGKNEVYIIHKGAEKALERGEYDLTEYANQLTYRLDILGIEYEGNPSIVGGLEIW